MEMKSHLGFAFVFFLFLYSTGNAQEIESINTTLRMGESRSHCLVDIRDSELALDDVGCNVDFWIVNLNGTEIMGKGNQLSSEALKEMARLPEGALVEIQVFADLDQEMAILTSGDFVYTRIIDLPEIRFRSNRLL